MCVVELGGRNMCVWIRADYPPVEIEIEGIGLPRGQGSPGIVTLLAVAGGAPLVNTVVLDASMIGLTSIALKFTAME
jgi:hypothetical protein